MGRNFQFHKGAIETTNSALKFKRYKTFNSIKVRLKLRLRPLYLRTDRAFNSIKVRLKPGSYSGPKGLITDFQFHKGAIETNVTVSFMIVTKLSIP